jgi:predicted MPP superfamily phosphohydrolase
LPALVANLEPDLIVLTGDFLSTSYNSDPLALIHLHRLLAQLRAPRGVYAVWGTPEVDLPPVLSPILADLGIIILEDRAVEITLGRHRLWLMGISCRRDLDRARATLDSLLADAPEGALSLLLFHTPDLMPHASSRGVDLVLSGHTHGGQWRVPGLGAILTSSHYWKRYEAGYYREGDTHLYVSRGLGMEGFGAPRARFFCPPEVVSVTLNGAGTRD